MFKQKGTSMDQYLSIAVRNGASSKVIRDMTVVAGGVGKEMGKNFGGIIGLYF